MTMSNNALAIVHKFFPDVTTVKDATRDINIDVTAADARSKGLKNHQACALALACRRKFHLDGAVVARSTVYLVKDNIATRYKLPSAAQKEVVAFDRGAPFMPGEYKLKRIAPSQALGQLKGGHSRKTAKRVEPYHITEGIRAHLTGGGS